ncbi:hypothetical protein WA1_50315 [Scytonema hofmannii PCC 7110]|uniref:Uncharacterized protein n=1 Tax=Scytonema hofmannii PCC 7110 TaxID=128403 RepID=A0A139WR61_9CYAN|nr:hypothetical protein [Scytonema hofmannii]KYC34921.1 hypothetical protein WA1_50315 [Scytonema hofmannii PCC 7110]
MSITIGQNEAFLLVPFNILQTTANSLRNAGVAINVKKSGGMHRILIQKKPEGFCITQLIQSLSLSQITTQANPSATSVEISASNVSQTHTEEANTTQVPEEAEQQLSQTTGIEAAQTLLCEPNPEIGNDVVTIETEETIETTETAESVESAVESNAAESLMATLDELEQQSLEQLQEWAKAHSIPGHSKMKQPKTLAKKLAGKIKAVQLQATA